MELPRAYYRYKLMELFTAWLITVETELHTNRHALAPSTLLRVQFALSRSFLWWINILWTTNTSVCNVKTAERKPREGGSILPLELEQGDIMFRGLWSTEASVGAQVNRWWGRKTQVGTGNKPQWDIPIHIWNYCLDASSVKKQTNNTANMSVCCLTYEWGRLKNL